MPFFEHIEPVFGGRVASAESGKTDNIKVKAIALLFMIIQQTQGNVAFLY
jgi:hypothetical protein